MSAGNGNPKFYNPGDDTYYSLATAGADGSSNLVDLDDVSGGSFVDGDAVVWYDGGSVFVGRPVVGDASFSPQILTGGALSDGTNNDTIKIGALTALLRTTDSATGVLEKISLAEQDNITMAAPDTTYHIVLQYNGGAPQIITQAAVANSTTNIGIGKSLYEADHTIHFQQAGMRLANAAAKLHQRAAHLREIELATGCTITDEGTSDFGVAAGTIYEGITAIAFSAFDSNPAGGNDTFDYVSRDGAGWSYTADQHDIDDSHYDDGTLPLGTITANQYSVHWVYIHPDDGHVYVVYGRASYKLAAAEEAMPPGTLPIILSDFAVLIGKIIYKTGETASTTIQMVTDQFFTGTAIGEGIAGPASATDGALVRWDGTSGTLVQDSPVTFPDADGTVGQVPATDGAGVVSWATHLHNSDIHTIYDAAQNFNSMTYVSWSGSQMSFTLARHPARIFVLYNWYGGCNTNFDITAKVYLNGAATGYYVVQYMAGSDDNIGGSLLYTPLITSGNAVVDLRIYLNDNGWSTYYGKQLRGIGWVWYDV